MTNSKKPIVIEKTKRNKLYIVALIVSLAIGIIIIIVSFMNKLNPDSYTAEKIDEIPVIENQDIDIPITHDTSFSGNMIFDDTTVNTILGFIPLFVVIAVMLTIVNMFSRRDSY